MLFRVESKNKQLTGFKYFWLKTVERFDENLHCAKCLIGKYDNKINAKIDTNIDIDLDKYEDETILYLCGVSSPYKWQNNFHLAMKVNVGTTIEKRLYNGDTLIIQNALEINFDDSVAKTKYAYKNKSFTTCRNFQFGSYYFNK